MKILVTGGCGFVGSAICMQLTRDGHLVTAMDSLRRRGSEHNVEKLQKYGIKFIHGDVRNPEDFDDLDSSHWIVDAAAEPSVVARTQSLLAHNVIGAVNTFTHAAAVGAGVIFLSTSRVYSINQLNDVPVGTPINESFSTDGPVSVYGATKLAGEALMKELRQPVIINRCGVLAGGGQFGHQGQGVYSWWIRSWRDKKPLAYHGFGGHGIQVRDVLHPNDLAILVSMQVNLGTGGSYCETYNVGGGPANAVSLAQLSDWCRERFGPHQVSSSSFTRPDDVRSVVMDNSKVSAAYSWSPRRSSVEIFEEIGYS